MGLQKPSNHVMAGKATMHLVDYENDDVEASSATCLDDGDDEHITVSLEMVEHIAVHVTVSLEMVSLFKLDNYNQIRFRFLKNSKIMVTF